MASACWDSSYISPQGHYACVVLSTLPMPPSPKGTLVFLNKTVCACTDSLDGDIAMRVMRAPLKPPYSRDLADVDRIFRKWLPCPVYARPLVTFPHRGITPVWRISHCPCPPLHTGFL